MLGAALDEHRLDAVAYPTLRRRPVVVEEPQRGTNCQLSATTGFPAMAMPAGFTIDGVPIGFELLGPAWSDQRLLAMAYAYEQSAKPRRPAPTTPPLVNGAVPRPIAISLGSTSSSTAAVTVTAEYDPVSGRLSMELPPRASAASIHRGEPGPDNPVLHRLIDPASVARRVTIVLPPYQRSLLLEGALRLAVVTPDGRATLPLSVPR
jgi:hypothetical protein